MKHKLFIVTLLVVMGIGSVIAQSSRRIQRIDREIQKTVFIPKGTWMAGGTVSYSEHNESNLNFLVLKDIEEGVPALKAAYAEEGFYGQKTKTGS